MSAALIRRIRPVNLVIIALTQFLLRYTLIVPFLTISGSSSAVSHTWFVVLVLSTLLIAAGGYLINDADDAAIDSINNTQITGQDVQAALRFYGTLLLLAGVIAGFLISFFGNLKTVWGIQLFAAIILYNYSSVIKRIPLLASLAVSFLTALSILIVYTSDQSAQQDDAIKKLVLGYSFFAFLISMARETIKDMQDIKGDEQAGRKTLPLTAGLMFSRLFSAFLLIAIVLLLINIQIVQKQWTSIIAFLYVIIFIQLPLLFIAIKIFRDKGPSQFKRSSQLCRLVMVAGVMTMPLFYFMM